MTVLHELLRHNRWATARVFKVCAGADPAVLAESAGGTIGTALSTLAHMVSVEEGFSAMIGLALRDGGAGGDFAFLVTPTGLSDGYFEHDLGWYAERAAALDSFLLEHVAGASADHLEHEIRVPWLDFQMTVGKGLTQVLVHNAHHRSQVFSVLGERGVRVPDLDYVIMLAKERSTAPS